MSWSPPPRRSIACCCGISTSCRNGPTASCAPRAGTASAVRRTMPKYGCRGVPDHLVVGCRTKRRKVPQRSSSMQLSRRRALNLIAGAAAAGAGRSPDRAGRRRRTPNGTACRPSAISLSRRLSAFHYVDAERAQGRHLFGDRSAAAAITARSSPSIRSTATSSRARARRAWTYTFAAADGARGRRARRHVRARRARGPHLRRRADLSFHAAAGSEIPRRHATDRARRRLVADDAEGQRPPDHHAVAARLARAPKRSTSEPSWCALPTKRARDVPLFVAGLPIFSRAYYSKQPFDQSTLDIPLGSGPYKVGRFEVGHFIEFERVQGLVGRRSAGCARPEQFRHHPLRILPRPRRRLRGFHREELSVSRGVHVAHLGDALRLSGLQGWPRQANGHSGRHAVRRARLVHEHAAREIQGSPPARGADRCVRLRMDQQEHHVRLLRPHAVDLREFAHEGERQAECRRSGAARAVPRSSCRRKSSASLMCRR